ncbi:MAG TPA: hypothetical protein VFR93_03925 [Candidatus Limnocylindrales bacterium]|nr:hypothetical protein [Candidatus Limnocylindrales bacterium]
MTTDVNSPDEKEQERLARQQGEAYGASYDRLMAEDPHAETEVDDYRVTASFEPAEGMYELKDDGTFHWMTPSDGQNQHFEVIVRDRRDGRFLPNLDVRMRLLDERDRVVADTEVPFIWHPFVLHYGVDGAIPAEGDYTAEVAIPAPRWHRHDEVRGRRYAKDVTVRLGPVHLTPGTKPHGPE